MDNIGTEEAGSDEVEFALKEELQDEQPTKLRENIR